jgi:hypothetical protein
MKNSELEAVKQKLLDAVEASHVAARKLREAAEFGCPIVGGDPQCVKNLRRDEAEIGLVLHELRERIDGATLENIRGVFQQVTKG